MTTRSAGATRINPTNRMWDEIGRELSSNTPGTCKKWAKLMDKIKKLPDEEDGDYLLKKVFHHEGLGIGIRDYFVSRAEAHLPLSRKVRREHEAWEEALSKSLGPMSDAVWKFRYPEETLRDLLKGFELAQNVPLSRREENLPSPQTLKIEYHPHFRPVRLAWHQYGEIRASA